MYIKTLFHNIHILTEEIFWKHKKRLKKMWAFWICWQISIEKSTTKLIYGRKAQSKIQICPGLNFFEFLWIWALYTSQHTRAKKAKKTFYTRWKKSFANIPIFLLTCVEKVFWLNLGRKIPKMDLLYQGYGPSMPNL